MCGQLAENIQNSNAPTADVSGAKVSDFYGMGETSQLIFPFEI
jgi:hypothetical protein